MCLYDGRYNIHGDCKGKIRSNPSMPTLLQWDLNDECRETIASCIKVILKWFHRNTILNFKYITDYHSSFLLTTNFAIKTKIYSIFRLQKSPLTTFNFTFWSTTILERERSKSVAIVLMHLSKWLYSWLITGITTKGFH